MKKVLFAFFGILGFCCCIISYAIYSEWSRNLLSIRVLDITLGDSILIQTPSRHTILVDGGVDASLLHPLSQSLPFYERTIDLLVLTHPDADHLNGLLDVVHRYNVKMILMPTKVNNTSAYHQFLDAVSKDAIQLYYAEYLSEISIDQQHKLEILHPTIENIDTYDSINNASVVFRLDYPGGCALLTGDIDKKIEKEILAEGKYIRCDILKVAHHGSKSSSAQEFIDEVRPRIAIISAGHNNKFGHPHQEVVERLSSHGAQVLNNTQEGTINLVIAADGSVQLR